MFESTASHTPSIDRDSLSDDDYEDALLDDDLTFGGPSSKSTVHTQLSKYRRMDRSFIRYRNR